MASTPPSQPPSTAADHDVADLIDYRQVREGALFVRGSLRRHRLLFASVLVGMMLATFLAVRLLPRTYHVESKLLAQPNRVMAALGNPHRAVPWDADAPTHLASETVLRRDNLVSLIKQTQLLAHWERTRIPLLRFKDLLFGLLAGPMTDEDKLDSMVGTLEKKLWVAAGDGTVTIAIDWPDAQMAYQLVEAAQQNFLEERHVTEVSAINEAISILETHASQTQVAIEDAIGGVQKVAEGQRQAPAARRVAPRARLSSAIEMPAQELAQLQFLIRSKRRAIADLEEFRSRRLTELQSELAEQKVIYSPSHPAVSDLQQRIMSLQQDSPQIAVLRKEEEALISQYSARGGRDAANFVENTPGARAAAEAVSSALGGSPQSFQDDPAMVVARDQLRIATAKYHDLVMRIDAARIELDTARAAFKFRYSVVTPAQAPKKPVSPNVPMLLAAGTVASVGLAFFLVVLLDLWRGRFLETFQVERKLGLKVLAEVRR